MGAGACTCSAFLGRPSVPEILVEELGDRDDDAERDHPATGDDVEQPPDQHDRGDEGNHLPAFCMRCLTWVMNSGGGASSQVPHSCT